MAQNRVLDLTSLHEDANAPSLNFTTEENGGKHLFMNVPRVSGGARHFHFVYEVETEWDEIKNAQGLLVPARFSVELYLLKLFGFLCRLVSRFFGVLCRSFLFHFC